MTNFEGQIAKARKRVTKMDVIDGYADRSIGTIVSALESGLKNPETGAQFDALVMLRDVLERERMKNG